MLAFNTVLVNLDSYTGGFRQNFYLYRDDAGRFLPVVWDLNESFGQFAQTGTIRLNTTNEKAELTPFLHENDAGWPLIRGLLSNPRYRRMYIAHCKTMLAEQFENGDYLAEANALRTTIDAAVQADPNKLTTYANFQANLTADVGDRRDVSPGIEPLMEQRASYLNGLAEFSASAPEIRNISLSQNLPSVGETVFLSVDALGATFVEIGYRTDEFAPFVKLEAVDDGQHGDGGAGDGRFGVSLTIQAAFTEYYVYTENDVAGAFSPARAQHEFYTLAARTTSGPAGDFVINELLAANDATFADQNGEFDDWVELYNNGNTDIDLSGYTLSDDVEEPAKWTFPSGTTLGAGEYLLIWADSDEDQAGLHTNFKLNAGGESVLVSEPAARW